MNSEKIKDLLAIVNKKQALVAKAEKADWKTNCTFKMQNPALTNKVGDPNDSINLQTVQNAETLVYILSFLKRQAQDFIESAVDLGVKKEFKWHDFTLDDWRSDIETRLCKINIAKTKKELATLQDQLNELMPEDAKREMKLKEIEAALEKMS